jgi:AraC family transcriptional regulator
MKPSERSYHERILRVQLHIQSHLSDDLALDRLARIACFSPYHFHRIFRGILGEGVHEYVRRLRLESAAQTLKNTGRVVAEVAFNAGYESHEAFTRAFRQMFGVTPTQFRAGQLLQPRQAEQKMTTTIKPSEVRIERHPSRRVLFLRHIGPYQSVGPTFQKFMAHVFQNGLFRPDAEILGICHDDPDVTPPDKIRYDCGMTVGDNVSASGEFGIQTIDGGEFAVTTHRGPYEALAESYEALYGSWLPASGREPRNSPSFEIYRNSPTDTTADNLVTEIFLPLAPK